VNETQIAELLDGLTPRYDDRVGDWERVTADAAPKRMQLVRVGVLVAAVAAIAAVALAWPFHSRQTPVLERALAAVGHGPVGHLVLRGEWGGTLVDLSNGERTPVYGENEYWWVSSRPRVHLISRLGGVVQWDEIFRPRTLDAELVAVGRNYQRALQRGTARIAGEGTLDGEQVLWITVHSELLPDVADGKDHEFAQQVAVSKDTFKPVALRTARDGRPGPMTLERIVRLEYEPAGTGNFARPAVPSLEGRGFSQSRLPLTLEQAPAFLGKQPLWLGREYRGLPLASVFREKTQSGRRPEIRVTGTRAAAAIRCSKLRGPAGRACFNAIGFRGSVRPDGVFTSGRFVWDGEQNDVVLFYGALGDDPSTYRKDNVPLTDKPNVTITEGTRASRFRRIVGSYVPPAGSVFVAAGGAMGVLHADGLQVTITATEEPAILAAARALEPMPAG
jgi:hypothetical protein